MKISESLLKKHWTDPKLATDELVEQITMAGLEVDGTEPAASNFTGVIVAEIVEREQHPDADKLSVCKVNTGSEIVQVVCGAANARVGIKVPFATVGAELAGEDGSVFKIKKAKLRGVESFGMLCAAQELGMAESSDGLLELPEGVVLGDDIRTVLECDDTIIEIDLTPNRADCFSYRGIARDIGVLNGYQLEEKHYAPVKPVIKDKIPVNISAPQDCGRYVGRVIRNVDVSKPTPMWIQEALRRSGIRSIDAIVDITNLVLIELGQPLHAFDLDLLEGGINVRLANKGEKLTLLDGQGIELTPDSLVIADEKKAVALAGIMGGNDTAVNDNTKDIFLESAFFQPVKIAGRARSYGLHTDSSLRFERGVDYELQRQAAERATQLILDCVGGEAGPIIEVAAKAELPTPATIKLREERISKVLGLSIPKAQVSDMLACLGLDAWEIADGWQVKSPSWRFDIEIEADLLEEIARIYGYNRLPVTQVTADLALSPSDETRTPLSSVRAQLVASGYQEAITYSFVDPKVQELVCPGESAVPLNNPISSDMAVMRTSLWPGLLCALVHNLNRQQHRVRLFETGLTFIPEGGVLPKQEAMLAGLITGNRHPESWSADAEPVDFYDLKGDLESVINLAGNLNQLSFDRAEVAALHPGQSAKISLNDEIIGHIGAIHPEIQKKLGISQAVYLFEIKLSAITTKDLPDFTPLSKHPEVRRDLAIIIDREIAANSVLNAVKSAAGAYLTNLTLFDIYEGKGIDPKRKSLALGLTFQHSSRTLNEDEVNTVIDDVVGTLGKEFSATLRS